MESSVHWCGKHEAIYLALGDERLCGGNSKSLWAPREPSKRLQSEYVVGREHGEGGAGSAIAPPRF